MRIIYTLILFILVSTFTARAQHHQHHHKRNEIGISSGAIYGIDHKEWGAGIHIHYFRTLGDHSRWAIGAFAEQAWLGDSHFSIGAGAKFAVIDKLQLGVFPGITFAKHSHDHDGHGAHDDHKHGEKRKARFSIHTELVYDLFEWNQFHLGPVLDYSWSENDSHTMIGIHVAYNF